MNYKEKFLKLFSFFTKNNDSQDPTKRNGKHISYDGNKRIEEWFKNGVLHREKGPAFTKESTESSGVHLFRKEWHINGKLHRENEPAIIHKINSDNFNYHWYKNGELHREDGPAIEYDSGQKEWFKNGLRHREDGPAIEAGSHTWYKDGKKHRVGGPAYYIPYNDNKEHDSRQECWENGKLHRVDGPAITDKNGYSEWRINGEKHREDGPAFIEKRNGKFHLEWWVSGHELSFEAFEKFLWHKQMQNEASTQNDNQGKKPRI